jgi:hypothetical protein
MQFSQFLELEGDEMARIIAAYETHLRIESVMALDAERKARRNNKKR